MEQATLTQYRVRLQEWDEEAQYELRERAEREYWEMRDTVTVS